MTEQLVKNNWIPIEEGVPKFCGRYFVTMKLKDDYAPSFVYMLNWLGREGWGWDNGRKISGEYKILAWQKIRFPKPYIK